MDKPVIFIRKSFQQKAERKEQLLVACADLVILIDTLRADLNEAEKKDRGRILSELKHARNSLKMARLKAAV